jgi:dihydroorotate dehydrogenase electron transfer subunit
MCDIKKNFCGAKILKNDEISCGIFSMILDAPEIAENARAGQFVMVYLNRGEMLLPRPISICSANINTGEIRLVYQTVGAGTNALSKMQSCEEIKLLGALGNGFLIEEKRNRVAIVGGGIGSPPLYFLANELKSRGIKTDIYLGFRSEPILTEDFKCAANKLFIAAENGNIGHRGLITEVLRAENIQYEEIFACGPKPLLRALADYAREKKIPCQVSMEERMACGLGTCVGCVVKVGETYVRICSEGPVFHANEVFI